MKKIVLVFGLIAGIIPSAMFFILHTDGEITSESMDTGQIVGYISMLVAFSTIFFAVKQFRDTHSDGSIKFGKAFLIGLYISLIASGIYATFWEVYLVSMEVNFVESYNEYQRTALLTEGKSEIEIEAVMAENAEMMDLYENNMAFRFGMTIFEILPVGILISLISALLFSVILKPKK